jgi:hypothetical protein
MTRGFTRQAGIPPVQCEAKTRRGTPCGLFARPGSRRCHHHSGAAPQVIRKGDERMTFAQLLQHDPRPIHVVLLEAVANADAAMRDMRVQLVERGEPVTAEQLDRFLNITRLTHHLAKTTVDTGIAAKLVEQQRAGVEAIGAFISEVLLGVLHRLPLAPAWREYLLACADHQLLTIAQRAGTHVMEAPEAPPSEEPTPPAEPILMGAAGN